jgi:transposase
MHKETKTFGTMTEDLHLLADWLKSHGIKDVAMESTGVFWKPIFSVLGEGFNLILANARHIKNVPGRKTDVKDSEWICKLLKCGLIAKSFIPPEGIMRLRDQTRYRQKLIRSLTSAKNQLIKTLESANIKLCSVFSDVYGKTSWNIIKMLASGQDCIDILSAMKIHGHIKASKKEIRKALTGTLRDHHVELLNVMIQEIEYLESLIHTVEQQIGNTLKSYEAEVSRLKTIPGIASAGVATLVAEIGVDMNQFHSEKHLASWAGLAPGNNESAGKKKSVKINPGNTYLKPMLVQCAWTAVKYKETFYNALFQRLRLRLGAKKAIIAVARKILTTAYFVLLNNTDYRELGANFIDAKSRDKKINYYKKQLENLGKSVLLTNSETATTAIIA